VKQLAEKLLKLEKQLNVISEKSMVPIGSLLVDFWRSIYIEHNGDNVKRRFWFLDLLSLIKYIGYFLFSPTSKTKTIKDLKILLCKSYDKPHYNRLIDFIPPIIRQSEVVKSDYKTIYNNLTIIEKILVVKSFLSTYIHNIARLKKVISENKISSQSLSYLGAFSIIKFYSAVEYLKRNKVQLIIVDYDRNIFAPIVLAANYRGIKTVSLQHGVINPPYGYFPILASEVWVWGKLWKDLLVEMGESPIKIKIVGSTIAGSMNKAQKSEKIKHIGIGPNNPAGDKKNQKLWNQIIIELVRSGYQVSVKLHPSMDKKRHGEDIFGSGCRIIDASEMENQKFFITIDLLIVSDSGLGYEAVVEGTPVAVVRESEQSQANDFIMIEKGRFPEIKLGPDIKETIRKISETQNDLLKKEQRFVSKYIYEYTCKEAENRILERIQELIH
jgi:hypothetical protein